MKLTKACIPIGEKMNNDEIKALIEIRSILISEYKSIPGKHEPSSLIRARDAAITLDRVIKKIDRLLKDNVNFKE